MAAAWQAEGLHQGWQDQRGILNRGKPDEADAVLKAPLDLARDGQRQARLAHATGAGKSEEAHLRAREQSTGRGDLPIPPNERGEWQREGRSMPGRMLRCFLSFI